MMKKISFVALSAFVCGCATQAELQVFTWPEGALITEQSSGRVVGQSPTSAFYNLNSKSTKDAQGCYLVNGLQAQWRSGVVGSSEKLIRLCGSAVGNYTIQIERPKGGDLGRDLEYANQREMLRAQQQQAKSAQDAALLQMYMATKPAPSSTRLPVECTRGVSGNYSCY